MFKAFSSGENWTAKSYINSKNKPYRIPQGFSYLSFRLNLESVIYNLLCEKMSKLSVMHAYFFQSLLPSLLAISNIFEISEMTTHA
jgi:hypothetical protein